MLSESDRNACRAVMAFLEHRLEDSQTIEWALTLKPAAIVERTAVLELLSHPSRRPVNEPCRTAWALIEESWSTANLERNPGGEEHHIRHRLRSGDRSTTLVADIVRHVAPALRVSAREAFQPIPAKKPRRPKQAADLLNVGLTSGDLLDPTNAGLADLEDIQFLSLLASALENAVLQGLDIARRIGVADTGRLWRLGSLVRVYYSQTRSGLSPSDVDEFHRGIAPAVKLLHFTVQRLLLLHLPSALPSVDRWRRQNSTVFVRLWAAMARHPNVVSADAIADFLQDCNDEMFWSEANYPEITELRGARFSEIRRPKQKELIDRILDGPRRQFWRRDAERERVAEATKDLKVRELERARLAGVKLPARAADWLEANAPQGHDLPQAADDVPFVGAATVSSVPRNPDRQLDLLSGENRLAKLERALKSTTGWPDSDADRANDWLHEQSNLLNVLADLEALADGGNTYPRLWNSIGWSHQLYTGQASHDRNVELASRVVRLLSHLDSQTLSEAVEGLSHWFDQWGKFALASPVGFEVWQRIWPLAVKKTNEEAKAETIGHPSEPILEIGDNAEQHDHDLLNSPVGKLITAFLAVCPSINSGVFTFPPGGPLRAMREAIIEAGGRAGTIAKARLIEQLPYFMAADREWAEQNLVRPLRVDTAEGLPFWRAVARRVQQRPVILELGALMAERALDPQLSREARHSLVISIVVEALRALRAGNEPAVPERRITQLLRRIDDEARTEAARVLSDFVEQNSRGASEHLLAKEMAAQIFHVAAKPFLRRIWPQERSLSTPGTSQALSDLPAASGSAFAEAVAAIEPFLVPFDSWSLMEYGFRDRDDGSAKLDAIADELSAKGLLRLLDLTVGSSEGAVVPRDLALALKQITDVAPRLATTPAFRRLATAARS